MFSMPCNATNSKYFASLNTIHFRCFLDSLFDCHCYSPERIQCMFRVTNSLQLWMINFLLNIFRVSWLNEQSHVIFQFIFMCHTIKLPSGMHHLQATSKPKILYIMRPTNLEYMKFVILTCRKHEKHAALIWCLKLFIIKSIMIINV